MHGGELELGEGGGPGQENTATTQSITPSTFILERKQNLKFLKMLL